MDNQLEWVFIYSLIAIVSLIGVVVYEMIWWQRSQPKSRVIRREVASPMNADLREQVEAATKELRRANAKLQKLDETKDEFVSMASHQLRTPLTSIKGYLSMVLEGDAGKISKDQRMLLEQAFTSSERMVTLIGDFLNVSRLQNGKFMIDRTEADLSKIVSGEVRLIQEVAKARDIGIAYHMPSHFPLLYLDADKIRQVIMNFLDNAVYYSPEHTTISVRLYTSDGFAICEVIDHGIGVPSDAHEKLFSKFFRAENARVQRPDGTGIGLYLAKKIIDGHGGKIIFHTAEGEGSTFGFRLPIKKLSTPPVSVK
jgi:signal transduction histidine kinase